MSYHKIELNSARNCLRYIIRAFSIKEIHIPYYLCACIRHSIIEEGCKINFYHIDKNFYPEENFDNDDFILYPNYWGISGQNVQKLAEIYKNLIVDNAHSFYSEPCGIASFTSVRKFFPTLMDGAILYTRELLTSKINKDTFSYIPQKLQYSEIVRNEKRIDNLELGYISDSTKNALEKIDFEYEKVRRIRLFNFFHERFGNSNLLDLHLIKNESPFCYPYLAEDENMADCVAKSLEKEGMLIYRYWNVMPESFLENVFYKTLIPIPLS